MNNKFRSWNEEYKRFYYFCDGTYYNEIECIGYGFSGNALFDWNNAEQYTGLTDKNGKEIYEGDIIKVADSWDDYGMMAGEIREIYYHEAMFKLKPKYGRGDGHYLEDGLEIEIIGNIHENA